MKSVTILLTSIWSSRDEMFLNVTDAQMEAYERDRGINFRDEKPNPAYFIVDCDEINDLPASVNRKKVNALSVYVDKSMENQPQIINVTDGARCQISVSNTTNSINGWDDAPIWFVNYTVYHGQGTDIEIVSGDSSKERSTAFHRIPECYLTEFKTVLNDVAPYNLDMTPAKAVSWIVEDNDISGNSRCGDQSLVERAALSALNFAAPIVSMSNETVDPLWINKQQQCRWKNIVCNNGHVTTLTVKNIGLSGTIATAIGWLPELQQAYFGKYVTSCCFLMWFCDHFCDESVVGKRSACASKCLILFEPQRTKITQHHNFVNKTMSCCPLTGDGNTLGKSHNCSIPFCSSIEEPQALQPDGSKNMHPDLFVTYSPILLFIICQLTALSHLLMQTTITLLAQSQARSGF